MDKKSLDKLLNTLSFIALWKSYLPFSQRGWVRSLGLHVQERKAGSWTHLQAGGSLTSYLDAWREGFGDWQIKKFDEKTWGKRFAPVVDFTYNIADYMYTNAAQTEGLNPEQGMILQGTIDHYKYTRNWHWLPGVAADLDQVSRQMMALGPQGLNEEITYAEGIRRASRQPYDWLFLVLLYDLAGRYRDMEKALKFAYELMCSNYKVYEWMVWRWRRTLGMLYFAAFFNAKHNKDFAVLGSPPSKVNPESLGYTVEEVRTLAVMTLEATLVDAKRSSTPKASDVQEIKSAIAACDAL